MSSNDSNESETLTDLPLYRLKHRWTVIDFASAYLDKSTNQDDTSDDDDDDLDEYNRECGFYCKHYIDFCDDNSDAYDDNSDAYDECEDGYPELFSEWFSSALDSEVKFRLILRPRGQNKKTRHYLGLHFEIKRSRAPRVCKSVNFQCKISLLNRRNEECHSQGTHQCTHSIAYLFESNFDVH